MDQDLRELFDLRWEERNRVLHEGFNKVNNEASSRGVLNSSITFANAHKVMVSEFDVERKIISATIIDFVGNGQQVTSTSKFQDVAKDELASRKTALEKLYTSRYTNMLSSFQSSSMLSRFTHLNETFPLAQKELSIELNNAVVTYNKSFGSNFTEQIRNRFLNHPVLAVVVLFVGGISFILVLLKMLELTIFSQ
jgi:hypothetical protein